MSDDAMLRARVRDILQRKINMTGAAGAMRRRRRRRAGAVGYGEIGGARRRRRRVGMGQIGGARRRRPRRAAGVMGGKRRAPRSPWIAFVKRFAAQHGLSYGEALSRAGPAYRKAHGRRGRGVMGGEDELVGMGRMRRRRAPVRRRRAGARLIY